MMLDQYFRGLADGTRVRILNLLLHGELCVCDIQHVLDSPQPNVSRHLTYLKNCGLVLDRRDGTRMFYRLTEARSGLKTELFRFLGKVVTKDPILQEDTHKLKEAVRSGSCSRSEWRPDSALSSARHDLRA